MKFVILDEVDYMTKNAQQALKCLLQSYNIDVKFCLICNYISRIDESLQNDVIFIPFCFHEAAANLLTNSALDPYGKIPELKYCAAKIEATLES